MKALHDLRDEDIQIRGLMISSPKALRSFLQQRPEVIALRRAVSNGEISPDEIAAFVEELLLTFSRGEHFADEITLAAIAVAIQNDPRPFAEHYLQELSNLEIVELPLAPRVAHVCLDRRSQTVIRLTDQRMSFRGQSSVNTIPFGEAEPDRMAAKNEPRSTLRIAS